VVESLVMVSTQALSSPALGIWLKIAMATYLVWVSRKFYVDPMGYFRRLARTAGTVLPELPAVRELIRWLACFCLWGGCFMIASAVTAQMFNLHGWTYAIALVVLAAIATYLLLPEIDKLQASPEMGADAEDIRRMK